MAAGRVRGLLASLIWAAAAGHAAAGTTELGHPVHTAPFTVTGAPHSLRWIDNSYFEFRNASLALGERAKDPATGGCRQTSPDKPLRYWWLHQDGSVEEGKVGDRGGINPTPYANRVIDLCAHHRSGGV